MDLLQRMLAFNPDQRCSAAEALGHRYFGGTKMEYSGSAGARVMMADELGPTLTLRLALILIV